MRTYFIHSNGATTGPYELTQIVAMWKNGSITADSLAVAVGTETWVPVNIMVKKAAESISGFRAFIRKFLMTLGCVFAGFFLLVFIGTCVGNKQAQSPPDDSLHYYTGTQTIKADLKSPSTAVFSSIRDPESGYSYIGKTIWQAWGYVDAQNSFGAKIRHKWMLIWDDSNKKLLYKQLGDSEVGDFDKAIAAGKE